MTISASGAEKKVTTKLTAGILHTASDAKRMVIWGLTVLAYRTALCTCMALDSQVRDFIP